MSDYFEEQQTRREKLFPSAAKAQAYAQDALARLLDLGWKQPTLYPPKPGQQKFIEFICLGALTQVQYRGPYTDYDNPLDDQAIANCFLWHGLDIIPNLPRCLDNPKVSAAAYLYVADPERFKGNESP